ncbi:hypothetical protein AAFF_G00316080 [Aldrovandia affinis]|uniref:Uncharacterized protein n=1 Tax=Aldrovandia affinis TaxID=143900 RepID=A0AAD7WQU2_9TELE|nr:hypothetical protein AAFF_G00316080 [Aldrovandia affinis]
MGGSVFSKMRKFFTINSWSSWRFRSSCGQGTIGARNLTQGPNPHDHQHQGLPLKDNLSLNTKHQLHRTFKIKGAFTAEQLGLAEHTQPGASLQRKYKHLKGVLLQPLNRVRPLLLIGSDYPHLITPIQPVHLGPPGGPAVVNTKLGWTLQGPTKYGKGCVSSQCLLTSTLSPSAELFRQVEKLWQLDTLPYRSKKLITRSKQDQEAVNLLDAKMVRVDVDGVQRYATPLLRVKDMPRLQASKEAVLANLHSVERRLGKDPEKATV